MADLFDHETGVVLTVGLPGCNVSDEARSALERLLQRTVRELDSETGELLHPTGVILDDDDGQFLVTLRYGGRHCYDRNGGLEYEPILKTW
jgi:hypothetical protein